MQNFLQLFSISICGLALVSCFDDASKDSDNFTDKSNNRQSSFDVSLYENEFNFLPTVVSESGVSTNFDSVMKFDYPDDGVEIGQGWNSFTERGTTGRCVEVFEVPIESSTFESDLREIQSTYSLKKSKSVAGKVSGSYGGFSGGASASYSKSQKLKTEDVHVLFSFRSNVSSTKAVGIPETINPQGEQIISVSQNKEFAELAPETQTFITQHLDNIDFPSRQYQIDLSKNARELLKKKKWKAFQNLCGNGFVSAVHRGTDINVVASFNSKDKNLRTKFRAEASGGGFGVKASVSTTSSKEIATLEKNTSFKIRQTGGVPLAPPAKFSDLRQILVDSNTFVQNPAGYEVTITPYINLGEYRDQLSNIETPDKLIRLADYYVVLQDVFDLVSRIHLEAIRTDKDTDNTPNYSRKVLNTYGGVQHLRDLKDKIELDMELIEQGIRKCLSSGLSCSEVELKSDLKQEITQEEMDSTDLEELSALAKKYGEKFFESRNESIVDEFAINNFESSFGKEKTPFSDTFFLQFYSYLSEIPLTKHVLAETQITPRANPLKPSNQLVNGIYSEYFDPWRSYFCTNLMSDAMCVNEAFLWDILDDTKFDELAAGGYKLVVPRKICVKRSFFSRRCKKHKTVYDPY